MARGSIKKVGTNKWRIKYDAPRGPDGKRKQKTETINGIRKQAEGRLAEVQYDILGGRYIEPTELTVAEYLDLWLRACAVISVRPRTLKGYKSIIRAHLKRHFGSIKVKLLEARHVQDYYAHCISTGRSEQTVMHIHRLFSQALKQAVRWRMLQRNVLEDVVLPSRRRPEMRFLILEEIGILHDAAEGTDLFMPIHLGISTGMRRSEILGLQWRDIDLKAQRLTVSRTMVDITGNPTHIDEPKSRRSKRTITYRNETADLIEAHYRDRAMRLEVLGRRLSGGTQVCLREDGNILKPDALSKGFKKIAGRCGLEGVRFHDLRHTHASLLLAANVPIHVVQARLGHASIQTTVDTYGHLMPDADAQAMLQLDHFVNGLFRKYAGNDHHVDLDGPMTSPI